MILDLLDFLDLDKSTLRKDVKQIKDCENKNENKEEEIECLEQNYQIIENKEIIEKDNEKIEIKSITELIPLGNKRAIKRTRIEKEHVLKR
ncbi:hypothetical protein [Campylobacter cuniculorum]|uniref:Uncharacterized protein n=2 Tax=Campylobacter cuniculorum TaxID=374106 RepID=A0A1W6BYJ1_9BACT|nr:hypothetical protein [Campylobacter cuniculorum]ARJ57132.1 hypothetical protein CCUN_1549 [Campylobacter cuniculorum DSM 23162 = LMG 24588]QOR04575.1 hypothetical protein A0071_01080 [Campylobacter cuniculorum]